jgi:hypothetical protein
MTLHQAEDFVLQVKDKTGRYPMIYGSNLICEGGGQLRAQNSQALPSLVCTLPRQAHWHSCEYLG